MLVEMIAMSWYYNFIVSLFIKELINEQEK